MPAESTKKKRSFTQKWRLVSVNNKMVVYFTGLIAVATVLYTIVAGWQLYEIHSGSKDTHALAVAAGKQADAAKVQSEQAKAQTDKMTESLAKTDSLIRKATEQATATNNLAQQAKRQADIAGRSLESEERPWIGLDHVSIPGKVTVGSKIPNSMFIKNWGKGPGINVLSQYQMLPLCGPFPIHPSYVGITSQSQTLLMPGQPVETGTVSFPEPLTDIDLANIKQPECSLYIYARVTYQDTDGRKHWRHLCAFWDKTTDNSFLGCPAYNDGDENYGDGKEP